MLLPALGALLVVGGAALAAGALILRRRGCISRCSPSR
jgi:hypothetical protein